MPTFQRSTVPTFSRKTASRPHVLLVLFLIFVLVLGFAAAGSAAAPPAVRHWVGSVTAGLERALPAFDPASAWHGESSAAVAGQMVTQSFTLQGGWTAIYLEIEPVNPSPLVNAGTAEDPIWEHEQSTLEAVFAGLSCGDCLESVWAWNVPASRVDYIVDPGEGLWDEPGWRRYFPDSALAADGESRGFLSDLYSLHAHEAYLVKLRDDAGTVTLDVAGAARPVHQRWILGAYNLGGFPVMPGVQPLKADFFADSPIDEVRRLNSAGRWERLAGGDHLNYGEGYLVFYADRDPDAPRDFTAGLNVLSPVSDGLHFTGGVKHQVRVENRSAGDASVQVSLLDPALKLRLTDPVTGQLWLDSATFDLEPYPMGAADMGFTVLSREQGGDAEAIVQVASPELGARWLIPASVQLAAPAGLWVGDVVVNDVSEGRLGATNVSSGTLTIALRQWDGSGIRGSAELDEQISGNDVSVDVDLSLSLPAGDDPPALTALSGAAPFVAGYVFVDENQNGQRDGDEPGLEDVPVILTSSGGQARTQTTGEDGSYLFEGLAADLYTLAVIPLPAGYTRAFPVTPPAGQAGAGVARPNSWPVEVQVDQAGVIYLLQEDHTGAQVQETDFPRYDLTDTRVEPMLNVGFVSVHDASLWIVGPGGCGDRVQKVKQLPPVLNASLAVNLASASLNPPPAPVDHQLLGGGVDYAIYVEEAGANNAEGRGVACGEIVVGSPTRFADGRGSDFRFRVILRVSDNGVTELLPYYAAEDGTRVNTAAFSLMEPARADGRFTDASPVLDFSLVVEPEDPLNPYKHKYHPDHDNLDALFNAIDFDQVEPYLWESYRVRRRMNLELTEDVPTIDAAQQAAMKTELDWGGATWGGLYKEVIGGIHKNDITVKGYFIIRQVLEAGDLVQQEYD